MRQNVVGFDPVDDLRRCVGVRTQPGAGCDEVFTRASQQLHSAAERASQLKGQTVVNRHPPSLDLGNGRIAL